MPGWQPLPTGQGATPMLKSLRAMNAQIHGTMFAAYGEIGDLTVTGDVIVGDVAGIFTKLSGWSGVIQFDDQSDVAGPDNAAYIVPGIVDEGDIGGGNHAWRADLLFYGMEWTAGGDLPWQRMTSTNQYHPGTGFIQWGFGASSSVWLDLDEAGFITSKKNHWFDGNLLLTDNGSSSAPTLAWNDGLGNYDTGVYRYSTDRVGFSTAGSVRLTVAADYTRFGNQVTAGNAAIATVVGSAGAPTFTFTSDANTGMWWPNADQLELVVGGARSILMRAAGVFIPQAYTQTNPAAANVFVYSNGQLARSTSSLKYKKGWSYAVGLADQALPAPIAWTDEAGQDRIGWGAEHVAETFPEAREHENYDLRSIVAVLSAKVLRSEAKIVKLERLVKEITGGIHK